MNDRRSFLKMLPALPALQYAAAQNNERRPTPRPASGRDRKRRLVWNNDGSDILQIAIPGGKWPSRLQSVDHYLSLLMKYVEGTQVDSIFYCGYVNQPDWELPKENIEVLGPNPATAIVDFAHKNGMEFFYSIRMNDSHASVLAPKASYWPQFRREHPELLLGNFSEQEWKQRVIPWIERSSDLQAERRAQGKLEIQFEAAALREVLDAHPLADQYRRLGGASVDFWSWACYDWSKKPVQARFLGVVDEACRRHDLDGIELDWMRHSPFLRFAQGRRRIPAVNDFMRSVSRLLHEHGKRRGREILLAVRTPDTLDLALSLGLDMETWVREGWVDLLMAGSGLMPFSMPMEEWADLGRRHNVPVYGCLDRLYDGFDLGQPKFDDRDPEFEDSPSNYDSLHAACQRFWDQGVDGIYLYDWHTHHGPTDPKDYGSVPPVGEAALVAKKDKLYHVDPQMTNVAFSLACVPGQVPVLFEPSTEAASITLTLDIADNPAAASRASVRTRWSTGAVRPAVEVNGVALGDPLPFQLKRRGRFEEGWLEFPAPPRTLHKGVNRLRVTLAPGAAQQPAELLDARVSIAYA